MNKELLAVLRFKDKIIEAVRENQVVVIEAPTGSGKTTQIPQILFNAGLNGWGIIGVTQPRRIAAVSVSARIAEEMEVELGRLVGYKIRFEDHTSAHTKIKIMTDGILLEELRSDPDLLKYSIIIVDEAHERSLNIDFILGLLKEILKKRKDFKVVVSSATINASLFSKYFNNAPIISVETKPYPIEVIYSPLSKKDDYEEMQTKIIEIVSSIENRNLKGDILIFLPGEDSIKDCCRRLEMINTTDSMVILPLYARLSIEEQNSVFKNFGNKRKVIIATNIAETSITIDGIVFVIDPGYSKINYYNPRTFTSFLELKPISKASCDQRKGRAGRTAPGVVYRLYSEEDYLNRDEYTREEIYRTDLSEVVLRMADLGLYNYFDFDFISPPNKGAIKSAIETLISINALDNDARLTPLGKRIVDFPIVPRLSRILIESIDNYPDVMNCILIIISFLSARTPFLYPAGEEIESRNAQRRLMVKGGDFFSWINIFFKYTKSKNKEEFCKEYYLDTRTMNEIVNIHSQLSNMVLEKGYNIGKKIDYDDILVCLCSGLKQYLCLRDKKKGSNAYHSATEKSIRIHPGSFLFGENPDWLVGGEIVNTGRTYIRTGAMISEKLIKNKFIDIYNIIRHKANVKTYLKEETTKIKTKIEGEKRVQILDKYFEIKKSNKQVYAFIPYHIIIQLKSRKERLLHYDFGDLKAHLYFKDILILKDRLNSLLEYFDKIDLNNGINTKYPKNKFLVYPDDWSQIFKYIKILLRPSLENPKSHKSGFLALNCSEENIYQFYLEDDFFTAIENSFNSLEKLFASEIKVWNEEEKKQIEKIHHKLSNYLEELEV
ncbi:MAG TPA: ATP-dependent RNA helicase [Spirochaetota bacterium]|nr:ATP-dependent RNA helicase [Spirochaetota bacterium]